MYNLIISRISAKVGDTKDTDLSIYDDIAHKCKCCESLLKDGGTDIQMGNITVPRPENH
jgi:hypothetical protein